MADFEAKKLIKKSADWNLLHLSECLEDRHIKHCIAADAVLTTLNHPLVICQLYLAVADEQLEDALAVMLQQGLQQRPEHDTYVEEDATIAPLGWPGYTLEWPHASVLAAGVSLVPSSFWHMDLSEASLSKSTFLHPTTRCRFPTRLFYLDSLISAVVKSSLESGHNRSIARYFRTQYHYLVHWLPWQSPGILLKLPPCDKFFVDLYGTPLPPTTRERVCLNRQQIQLGVLTVENAWKSMPMNFIETIKKIADRKQKMRRKAAEVG
ncbi:uncharacterized protein N7515_009430 [Penicillium bovifimosum]|uniref:Uncharacterized protein n=1 Tax=Penicillium bovifimosum TaxID=126998 RepID=A0A9W9GKD4_9EURO|nr:uncharacterized protein N7515_009430 [Penicillium bovifimosum]KAJ5121469.1 hypothetical protein N7515_009430 [Penicillium bovifimosum]